MRVLALSHPEADYGAALLFRGLCTVLGEENVVDYPAMPTWRGKPSVFWPRGHVPHLPDYEGWTAEHPWFKPVSTPESTTAKVLADLSERRFDLVVLLSCRAGVWATWSFLRAKVSPLPRAVVCDHEDHNVVPWSVAESVGSPILFKRELFHVQSRGVVNAMPLPFSCAWGDKISPGDPEAPRAGAFLSCSFTHPQRHAALAAVKDCPHVVSGENAAHGEAYGEGLRRAAIGISVRGHGVDTLRHWEVPFFGGCLLTDSTVLAPNDFIRGQECLRFDNPHELGTQTRDLLQDPIRLRAVAKAGQEKLLRYHTPKSRAEYFLRETEQAYKR